VTVEWTAGAIASARRYIRDQAGMRAVTEAVASLAEDPLPPGGFHRGEYHRLRIGPYRVMYAVDDDVITVERVDRLNSD
jgi:mRNA interferase RelE/StbE